MRFTMALQTGISWDCRTWYCC